jgi:hypothetical protein
MQGTPGRIIQELGAMTGSAIHESAIEQSSFSSFSDSK